MVLFGASAVIALGLLGCSAGGRYRRRNRAGRLVMDGSA
jgi:hypothetical protein